MPNQLQSLRQQLRDKFPDAHHTPETESLPILDSLPPLPKGAITELSPATPASGLSLILSQLLQDPNCGCGGPPQSVHAAARGNSSPISDRQRVRHSPAGDGESHIANLTSPIALIDGRDAFDPASHGPDACSRLLWIRCRHAAESLHCTDLLLRDGNLPLLVLDLQLTPLRELNDIPSSSWHRLRNLARQSGTTLLAFTPRPHIPAAALQLILTSTFHLQDLEVLASKLAVERPKSKVQSQRTGS